MFLRVVEEKYVNKRWGHETIRRLDLFSCDDCKNEFTLGFKAVHATSTALTFCGKACNKRARSTGALADKWKKTKLERYGVEFSSQVQGATQKMIASRIEKTGAAGPAAEASASNERWRASMVENLGVDHPSKSAQVKAQKKSTYQARYGVDNPLSAGSKFRPSHDDLSTYGQIGYRSTAREGSWMIYKPEKLLVEFLHAQYAEVRVQVEVEHEAKRPWLVDAYVPSIDTYVQLDGEFWHGLDKPYDQLHPKGKESFDKDRDQDAWFRTCGMKLVRVTDKELMTCVRTNDWSFIVMKLGG